MEFVKPTSKAPAPGRDVDAFCTKCKLELAHVIISMEGSRIKRVQCKTCNSPHVYRDGPPKPRQKKAGSGGSKKLAQSEFDRLMADRDISQAKAYKPSICFETNDVVNHPKFGLGLVLRVLQDDKIETAFREQTRVLVHAR